MVSKKSSSKVMDFSFLQSKATGFYQRSHLDNPKRPHSATSDFPQSLASWACRGAVGVGGHRASREGGTGTMQGPHAARRLREPPSAPLPGSGSTAPRLELGSGAVGGRSLTGNGRAGGEGWSGRAGSEQGSLTGLCCPPAAVWLGWEMNTFFKRSEFCSFFEREQRCLPSGGAGLCFRSSLL